MSLKNLVLKSMAIAMIAVPAVAHHSYAMFDGEKTVTLEGTVKKFQWTNPHSLIFVAVTDASGQSVDWAIEHGSPAGLARQGWNPKTLTPGMKVTMVVHPLKDGNPGGQFMSVTLPDGTKLGDSTSSETGRNL